MANSDSLARETSRRGPNWVKRLLTLADPVIVSKVEVPNVVTSGFLYRLSYIDQTGSDQKSRRRTCVVRISTTRTSEVSCKISEPMVWYLESLGEPVFQVIVWRTERDVTRHLCVVPMNALLGVSTRRNRSIHIFPRAGRYSDPVARATTTQSLAAFNGTAALPCGVIAHPSNGGLPAQTKPHSRLMYTAAAVLAEAGYKVSCDLKRHRDAACASITLNAPSLKADGPPEHPQWFPRQLKDADVIGLQGVQIQEGGFVRSTARAHARGRGLPRIVIGEMERRMSAADLVYLTTRFRNRIDAAVALGADPGWVTLAAVVRHKDVAATRAAIRKECPEVAGVVVYGHERLVQLYEKRVRLGPETPRRSAAEMPPTLGRMLTIWVQMAMDPQYAKIKAELHHVAAQTVRELADSSAPFSDPPSPVCDVLERAATHACPQVRAIATLAMPYAA